MILYYPFLRYGAEWACWSCTSSLGGGEERTLDLRPNESISSVSGYSYDSDGWTYSLQASTTGGQRWVPLGIWHREYDGTPLRKPPADNLRLVHLSGNQNEDNWTLR